MAVLDGGAFREHRKFLDKPLWRAAQDLGVGAPFLSLYERNERMLTLERWIAARKPFALGRRAKSEREPVWLLAASGDGRLRFLFDEHGRLGVFRRGDEAAVVADGMAPYGFPTPCIVPCWWSQVEALLAEIDPGPGYAEDRGLELGVGTDPARRKTAAHVASVVARLVEDRLAEAKS